MKTKKCYETHKKCNGENCNLEKPPIILKFPSGAYYLPNKKGIAATLFQPIGGKTADGFYQVKRNGVLFLSPTKEPRFFLVANPGQSQFFVSCGRTEKGRICYSFALSSLDGKRIMGEATYSTQCNLASGIWESVKPQ